MTLDCAIGLPSSPNGVCVTLSLSNLVGIDQFFLSGANVYGTQDLFKASRNASPRTCWTMLRCKLFLNYYRSPLPTALLLHGCARGLVPTHAARSTTAPPAKPTRSADGAL